MDFNRVHEDVRATYTIFNIDAVNYIQVDTYGTNGREIPGKKSQSFQLDEKSGLALVQLIRRTFNIP